MRPPKAPAPFPEAQLAALDEILEPGQVVFTLGQQSTGLVAAAVTVGRAAPVLLDSGLVGQPSVTLDVAVRLELLPAWCVAEALLLRGEVRHEGKRYKVHSARSQGLQLFLQASRQC